MRFNKQTGKIITILLILFLLPVCVFGISSETAITNSLPNATDIRIYDSYINYSTSTEITALVLPLGQDTITVYIATNITDLNGYNDLQNVTFKIVKLISSSESDFDSFGTNYTEMTLESQSGKIYSIYESNFTFNRTDDSMTSSNFYRIKLNMTDNTTSSFANHDVHYTKEQAGGGGGGGGGSSTTENESITEPITYPFNVSNLINFLTNPVKTAAQTIQKTLPKESTSNEFITEYAALESKGITKISKARVVNLFLLFLLILFVAYAIHYYKSVRHK